MCGVFRMVSLLSLLEALDHADWIFDRCSFW